MTSSAHPEPPSRRELPPARHEMNVTPMLDVLLVLLVIFMAAVEVGHKTLDVQLPVPCGELCAGESTSIVLEILPGPRFLLNKSPIAPSDLLSRLRSVYAERPDKIIEVAGHPGATYEQVVSAIDVARSAGVRVVGIAPKESYQAR